MLNILNPLIMGFYCHVCFEHSERKFSVVVGYIGYSTFPV